MEPLNAPNTQGRATVYARTPRSPRAITGKITTLRAAHGSTWTRNQRGLGRVSRIAERGRRTECRRGELKEHPLEKRKHLRKAVLFDGRERRQLPKEPILGSRVRPPRRQLGSEPLHEERPRRVSPGAKDPQDHRRATCHSVAICDLRLRLFSPAQRGTSTG